MRVFEDAKRLSSSVFVGAVLASIRSVVVLRLLGPALIGAWKTAMLADAVGEVARCGILRGMSIRVPMLAGEGKPEEANRTSAAAGGFLLWLGLALGGAILGASFLIHDANIRLSLRFFAFVVALAQPYYYIRELAGTSHRFVIRSREELLRSVTDLLVAVVLCRFLGLYGLGISTWCALVLGTVFYLKTQQIPFRLTLDKSRLRELNKVGLPFSMTEAGYAILRRVDVWVIAMIAGPTAVGFYGICILIMDFAVVLSQKGVAQVLSPHLMKEFGRTKSRSEVAVFYEIPARLFCYLLPPLLGAGTFLIGTFTHALLPQFSAGVDAAEVTLWTALFTALHFSVNSYFPAADVVPKIIKLMAGAIGVAVAAQVVVLKLGYGIEGAAWCTLATSAAWAAVELYVACTSSGESSRRALVFIASLYLPLAWCIAMRQVAHTVPLNAWFPAVQGSPLEPVARMMLFLLLCLPVLAGSAMTLSMERSRLRSRGGSAPPLRVSLLAGFLSGGRRFADRPDTVAPSLREQERRKESPNCQPVSEGDGRGHCEASVGGQRVLRPR